MKMIKITREPKRNELCDLSTFCNIEHCGNCIHCEDRKIYNECWCSRKEKQINWFSESCKYFRNKNKVNDDK